MKPIAMLFVLAIASIANAQSELQMIPKRFSGSLESTS